MTSDAHPSQGASCGDGHVTKWFMLPLADPMTLTTYGVLLDVVVETLR